MKTAHRTGLAAAVIAVTVGGAGLATPTIAQQVATTASVTATMPGVIGGSSTTAPVNNSYFAQTTSASSADSANDGRVAGDGGQAGSGYTPPTAAQLIQLLAPVAVFPDNLVAQVLAAASYPDQVAEANGWLAQNASLKGAALQSALEQQSWDPGVKAIVAFPDVLHQMADNPQWTSALGEAYVNDPTDVLNAVQALRQKAIACGNLKTNKYVKVNTVAREPAPVAAPPTDEVVDDEAPPPVYDGPPVIEPPERIVEIVPAEPDYVYVPYFDPGVFYGPSIGYWPGYAYAWPAPVYYGPAFGAFAFGAGISIDIGLGRPWGWGRWRTSWGHGYYGHGYYGHGGWHGPSVVYNNRPYFDHSTHIVNHFSSRASYAGRVSSGVDRAALANRGAAIGERGGLRGSGFNRPGSANLRNDRFAASRNVNFDRMATPHFTGAMAERGRNSLPARGTGLNPASAQRSVASRSAATLDRGGATFNRAPAAERGGLASRGYAPANRGAVFNRDGGSPSSRGPAFNRDGAVERSAAVNRGGYDRGGVASRSSVARAPMQSSRQSAYSGREAASRSAPRPMNAPRQMSAPRQFAAPRPMSAPRQFASAPRQMSAPRQASAPQRGSGGGDHHH